MSDDNSNRNKWGARFTPEERREWQRKMMQANPEATRNPKVAWKSPSEREIPKAWRSGDLAQRINDAVSGKPTTPTTTKPKQRTQQPIEADGGSTCFASLMWEPNTPTGKMGTVTAVFNKSGKAGDTYQYQVSKKDFQEWASDSQGGWFNASDLYENYD
jgi:hypothetical protein